MNRFSAEGSFRLSPKWRTSASGKHRLPETPDQGDVVTLEMPEVLVAAVVPLVTAMPMQVVADIEIVRLLPNWIHELPLVE
jgi:hypothetical protein